MLEKDLNRIIVKSLKTIEPWGFGHKISDDANAFGHTSKKPFDYFGATSKFCIYSESKLIKGGLYSFNFKRLEAHQIVALTEIKQSIIDLGYEDKVYSLVSVGFWETRKFFYVIFIDISTINALIANDIMSIKKKEIERIIEDDMYLKIKSDQVLSIEDLPSKIIYNLSQYRK